MNWNGSKLIEAPLSLAVRLSDVKSYLRIETNNEDVLLKTLIKTATKIIENYLQRAIITQTWKLTKDNFTSRFDSRKTSYNQEGVIEATKNEVYNEVQVIHLPMGTVQSIINLTTYNDDNVATIFNSASYTLDNINDKSRLVLNDQETWPSDLRLNSAIEINYITGYGDNHVDVPDDLKLAITMLTSNMYENRCGEVAIGGIVSDILSAYKIFSLG